MNVNDPRPKEYSKGQIRFGITDALIKTIGPQSPFTDWEIAEEYFPIIADHLSKMMGRKVRMPRIAVPKPWSIKSLSVYIYEHQEQFQKAGGKE